MANDIFLVRAIDKVIKSIAEYIKSCHDLFLQLFALSKGLFQHTFLEYSKDFSISFNSIFCPSFANSNIISYYIYAWVVCLRANKCSKCLHTNYFFLTY